MVNDIRDFAADIAKLVVVPIVIVGSMAFYAIQVTEVSSEAGPTFQPRTQNESIVSVRSNLDDIY